MGIEDANVVEYTLQEGAPKVIVELGSAFLPVYIEGTASKLTVNEGDFIYYALDDTSVAVLTADQHEAGIEPTYYVTRVYQQLFM